MTFTSDHKPHRDAIIALFIDTFTASEGAAEGQMIGMLVRNLLTNTPDADRHVFCAFEGETLTGAIVLSKMTYAEDTRTVFILSPVAVATSHQGQGVGQALIRHGLAEITSMRADIALTYGDINFYKKVGFEPISIEQAPPPQPLEYPEGWLGQSLSGDGFTPIKGASTCVDALNDPQYW